MGVCEIECDAGMWLEVAQYLVWLWY